MCQPFYVTVLRSPHTILAYSKQSIWSQRKPGNKAVHLVCSVYGLPTQSVARNPLFYFWRVCMVPRLISNNKVKLITLVLMLNITVTWIWNNKILLCQTKTIPSYPTRRFLLEWSLFPLMSVLCISSYRQAKLATPPFKTHKHTLRQYHTSQELVRLYLLCTACSTFHWLLLFIVSLLSAWLMFNKLISGYVLVHVQYIVTDSLIMHKGVSHVIYGVHLNS